MAARRRRPGRPHDDGSVRATTTGALGVPAGDLGAAAGIIADGARALAAGWSRKVPPSISVQVSGQVATITADAGPAYPNEVAGVRHPTFGHEPWVTNQHRPFLGPAADARSDAAMQRYAQKIDKWCKDAGFR